MSKLDTCDGCNKDISRQVEHGGAHFTIDGDTYCTKECHRKDIDSIAQQTSTEAGLMRYLGLAK